MNNSDTDRDDQDNTLETKSTDGLLPNLEDDFARCYHLVYLYVFSVTIRADPYLGNHTIVVRNSSSRIA